MDLQLIAILKSCRLRPTASRMAILNVINKYSPDDHFTIDDICNALKRSGTKLSISTVYRTLGELEYANIITKHQFDSVGVVYEKFSSTLHGHVVCTECGNVSEFDSQEIETIHKTIAREVGSKLLTVTQTIYVICKRCLKR
jgi:Fur family ferric uptake transcriptional regulator